MTSTLILIGMATLGDFMRELGFLHGEWWPLLLLGPAMAGLFVWGHLQRGRTLAQLGHVPTIARLTTSVHKSNRVVSALLVCLAGTLFAVALMRPQYGGTAKIVPMSGLDVVLVVDYSKSMLARDVYPSRSERLEAELARFLDDANGRGDRVGVVVFAGSARGFPLTRDTRLLKLYLDRADPRSENPGGTAIGRGLTLALQFLVDARSKVGSTDKTTLQEAPPAEHDQAIVLLTDGEDTVSKPAEVAKLATQLGVRIYTVGIGSKSGEPVQKFNENGEPDGFVTDKDGNFIMTRLDEDTLKSLAETTNGAYVHVDPQAFGLEEVRDVLETLSRSQRDEKLEIQGEEAFPFVLWPALALLTVSLMLNERRRPSTKEAV